MLKINLCIVERVMKLIIKLEEAAASVKELINSVNEMRASL